MNWTGSLTERLQYFKRESPTLENIKLTYSFYLIYKKNNKRRSSFMKNRHHLPKRLPFPLLNLFVMTALRSHYHLKVAIFQGQVVVT
jgi:hypothetical protein